jgi:hypothetical protein
VLCWFENDIKEYNKITGSIEEKVNSSLTDNKALLQPALAWLIDTIKRQPDIFSNLLMMSTRASIDQNYSPSYINRQDIL